ncbi:MAG: SIMPL domain-containing protein [bacterium]|nr:SIMPL domain-containing protein [bacterium]
MNGELLDQKKKLVMTLVAVGVVLALFLAMKTLGEIKGYGLIGKDISPQTTISVSGKGEIMVIPDIATVSFSVITEGTVVSDVQENATKKMNAAIAAVRGFGVEEKDIKTTGYNISPRYEYSKIGVPCTEWGCPPGKQILTGYQVSQNVSIKIRKIADAGKILSKLGETGVSDISGLTFSIDKEDVAKNDARGKAIDDAQAQAKVLAKQLGVSLVRIVSFSESGNYPIYYGKAMGLDMAGAQASAPVPEIPAGENTITSNVTITYEIR